MNGRAIAVGVVGGLSVLIGLAFLLWPTGPLALDDRVPVALLFLIPGLIGLDDARRRR